jgi:nitroreductase
MSDNPTGASGVDPLGDQHDAQPHLAPSSYAEALQAVLLRRRSVRQFTPEVIPEVDLLRIVEAGVYAPSGSNAQNQRFLILRDHEEKQALGRLRYVWPYPSSGTMRQKKASGLIGGATAVIVVFADTSLTDRRDNGEYYIWQTLETQNSAAAIENMLNMATALGIGSCWVSATSSMTRSRLVGGQSWATALADYDVPAWFRIQGVVILGYPKAGYDDLGFPKGERMHGASTWSPTVRRPVADYLVAKRPTAALAGPLGRLEWLRLRSYAWLSARLLRWLAQLDRRIYQLEVRRALGNPKEPESGP